MFATADASNGLKTATLENFVPISFPSHDLTPISADIKRRVLSQVGLSEMSHSTDGCASRTACITQMREGKQSKRTG